MADKFIGRDYTVSDIDVKIVSGIPDPVSPVDGFKVEWVHYEHIRMEILEYHDDDDTYTAELKTGDQHDGKRIKVSKYALESSLPPAASVDTAADGDEEAGNE
jgi:hypothetical protein